MDRKGFDDSGGGVGNFVFIPFTCQKGVQGGVGTIITLGNGLSFFLRDAVRVMVLVGPLYSLSYLSDMFGDVRITLGN